MTRAGRLARLRLLEGEARKRQEDRDAAKTRAYVEALTEEEVAALYARLTEAREDPAEVARLDALSLEDLWEEIRALLEAGPA